MFSSIFFRLTVTSLLVFFIPPAQQASPGSKAVVHGWLSDEGCAGERAKTGLFNSTNPECAKKCVRNGKRIVLVDPDQKRLLTIANQDAAMERIGDYVEISGEVDEQAKTLRIESLKLLEKGRAMCDVPPKKKS
ncbi:MAG TPA: hypothetical protein VEW05_14275 [Candidatus Polarisedimenticolia bacterium]|nr:hypothetical protein [Candidatus Polarisedimenticolia bacterium]